MNTTESCARRTAAKPFWRALADPQTAHFSTFSPVLSPYSLSKKTVHEPVTIPRERLQKFSKNVVQGATSVSTNEQNQHALSGLSKRLTKVGKELRTLSGQKVATVERNSFETEEKRGVGKGTRKNKRIRSEFYSTVDKEEGLRDLQLEYSALKLQNSEYKEQVTSYQLLMKKQDRETNKSWKHFLKQYKMLLGENQTLCLESENLKKDVELLSIKLRNEQKGRNLAKHQHSTSMFHGSKPGCEYAFLNEGRRKCAELVIEECEGVCVQTELDVLQLRDNEKQAKSNLKCLNQTIRSYDDLIEKYKTKLLKKSIAISDLSLKHQECLEALRTSEKRQNEVKSELLALQGLETSSYVQRSIEEAHLLLEKQLADLEQVNTGLKSSVLTREKTINDQERELMELRKKLLKKPLSVKLSKGISVSSTNTSAIVLSELTQKLQVLETEVRQSHSDKETLQNCVFKAQRSKSQMELKLNELSKKHVDATSKEMYESKLREINEKLQEIAASVVVYKNEIVTLDERICTLLQESTITSSENLELKNEVQSLISQQSVLGQELLSSKEELRRLPQLFQAELSQMSTTTESQVTLSLQKLSEQLTKAKLKLPAGKLPVAKESEFSQQKTQMDELRKKWLYKEDLLTGTLEHKSKQITTLLEENNKLKLAISVNNLSLSEKQVKNQLLQLKDDNIRLQKELYEMEAVTLHKVRLSCLSRIEEAEKKGKQYKKQYELAANQYLDERNKRETERNDFLEQVETQKTQISMLNDLLDKLENQS